MTAISKPKRLGSFQDGTRDDWEEMLSSGLEANAVDTAYRFLVEAGVAFDNSLDEEDTLRTIATLAIPVLGDWSIIDVPGEDGSVRRISGAHRDSRSQPFLRALRCQSLLPLNKHPAVNYALEVPRLRILTDLRDFFRPTAEQDAVYRMTILAAGFGSCLVLPLVTRGRVLAVLSVVSVRPRSYRPSDLALAEAFARQAAQALDNARLQKEAREAGSRKDECLTLLAHELRNPLTVIRNALQLLRQCRDDAAKRESVEAVLQRQTAHLGCLIQKMLEFSRIIHGKVQLEKKPVDVAQVVRFAIDTVRPCIDHRGRVLEVDLPPRPVILEADQTLLAEVLTNLLGNAAKFTQPGGRIRLSAEVAGNDIVFRIRDNGIGIAPDVLGRVFDLFWQSSRTADHSEGGLGVGLALVRQIVAMHGGSVSAVSAGLGKGSEFVVRLPRVNFTEGDRWRRSF